MYVIRQTFVRSLLCKPPARIRFNSTTSTASLASTLKNLRSSAPTKPNLSKSNPRNEEQVLIKRTSRNSRELDKSTSTSKISRVHRSLPLPDIKKNKISHFRLKKYVAQPLDWSTFDKRSSIDMNTLTPKYKLSEEDRIHLWLEVQGGDYVRYCNIDLENPSNSVSMLVGGNASYALTDKEKISNVIFRSINCND